MLKNCPHQKLDCLLKGSIPRSYYYYCWGNQVVAMCYLLSCLMAYRQSKWQEFWIIFGGGGWIFGVYGSYILLYIYVYIYVGTEGICVGESLQYSWPWYIKIFSILCMQSWTRSAETFIEKLFHLYSRYSDRHTHAPRYNLLISIAAIQIDTHTLLGTTFSSL